MKKMHENLTGWRALLPYLALGLLILGNALVEAITDLIRAVAGAL